MLTDLRRVLSIAKEHEKEFVAMLQTNTSREQRKDLSQKEREYEETEKRIQALDGIIQNLYEYKIKGDLTQECFKKMSQAYEQEQEMLSERVKALRSELSSDQEETSNLDRFLRLVKRYIEISELTPEIVRTFIEKIIVYEKEVVNGKRRQQVEIIYNCVGAIPSSA